MKLAICDNEYNDLLHIKKLVLEYCEKNNYFFEIFIVNFTYKFSNFIHISFLIVLLDISLFYQNRDKLSTHTKNFLSNHPHTACPSRLMVPVLYISFSL